MERTASLAQKPEQTFDSEADGTRGTDARDRTEPVARVSIYRCDHEMRVSEVLYSDHVLDYSQFLGGTDYDWLPRNEAEVVMRLKWSAAREQRPVRDTLTLTFQGEVHTFRIAAFPDRNPASGHSITLVATEIVDMEEWLRTMDVQLVPEPEPEMPRIGLVRMDNATRTLIGPERNVHLSGTEWRLLRQLSNAHGGVVSHEQLLSAIWGSGYSTAHHLLHDAVSRLRHRFRAAGVARAPIETVHGVGYRLREEDEVC